MCLWALIPVACSADGDGRAAVGSAVEAFDAAYGIINVAIDPHSYHFAIPSELLVSTEGCGPRSLSLAVLTGVSPHISFVGTHTPSHGEISRALGWDVAKSVELTASTIVLIPVEAYARLDAYTTYQKTTWTMVGLGNVVLGLGATYRPIGVFFSTCGCIGPGPCSTCAAGFPPGAPGTGANTSQSTWGSASSAEADAGADGG
jgi:hypothetical protein